MVINFELNEIFCNQIYSKSITKSSKFGGAITSDNKFTRNMYISRSQNAATHYDSEKPFNSLSICYQSTQLYGRKHTFHFRTFINFGIQSRFTINFKNGTNIYNPITD